ncbi:hypothetical protein CGRA01v4_13953 [Colletotrichum graminicola]|uniref:Small secreted protein n=1 Tax=Colletotrichum graminicola (strain M1.001 / M2 / FGSC 10212) TaxID=645133 RepID=E3QUP2_COLGM|nr:uncharacterized protein GLRG_09724 [Colletotrichum graminicola M1.001]EFQ34580.1 hypothetical protein GLRG_09724 [Colletotrichum graminicola M1.001]WDK22663.1 hypothetical protein CGRA01v4_13953 [Colletotrichum graminicola]
MRLSAIGLRGLAIAQATAFTALNITALSSRDGYSVIECWQLTSVPDESRAALNYVVGGDLTRAEWSIIQPRTTVGEAWAPAVQLSVIVNGLIRITSPAARNSSQATPSPDASSPPGQTVAYIQPGTVSSSVVIAADLKNVSVHAGHFTEFPGDEPTVLVQVPFGGNAAPEHTVVGEGPCERATWEF